MTERPELSAGFAGVELRVRPELLTRSHEVIATVDYFGRPVLLVHSVGATLQGAVAMVRWHDEPSHCCTWSEGCRCDLGAEG